MGIKECLQTRKARRELKEMEEFCKASGYEYHVTCEGYPEIYAPRDVSKEAVIDWINYCDSEALKSPIIPVGGRKLCFYSHPPFHIHIPLPMPEQRVKSNSLEKLGLDHNGYPRKREEY